MREYPAYARTIASHIVRGAKPICVAVLLSSRWGYFDKAPKICIKPDEWQRGRYEFGYLQRMHVVAVPGDDCEARVLAELLIDLMAAGPRWLWAYDLEGKKLYDGDFADDICHWALSLAGVEVIPYELAKVARSRMERAQAGAAADELRELEAITLRRGPEGAIASFQREQSLKQTVRELFAAPFQDSGEPAAA